MPLTDATGYLVTSEPSERDVICDLHAALALPAPLR